MESLDLQVLADVLAWRRAGHDVTLVTVVQTWAARRAPLARCWRCAATAWSAARYRAAASRTT